MGLIQVCADPTAQMGALTINGIAMNVEGWFVLNLFPLWIPQTPPRGANLTIPGASGKLARPRRLDEARVSLPMLIAGDVDTAGNPISPTGSQWANLLRNFRYLRDNVVEASYDLPVGAQIDMPDASSWTADVQCPNILLGDLVATPVGLSPLGTEALVRKATLEMIIPAGGFTDPGDGGGGLGTLPTNEQQEITISGGGAFTLHIPGYNIDVPLSGPTASIFDLIGALSGFGLTGGGVDYVVFGGGTVGHFFFEWDGAQGGINQPPMTLSVDGGNTLVSVETVQGGP